MNGGSGRIQFRQSSKTERDSGVLPDERRT